MVSANGHALNGNGHVLHCDSDYEPRPIIDVVATKPAPKWRDSFAMFTHNLSWQDADGCNHSLTLRSDSITDLLADLKMIKAGIRQAKEKAAQSQPLGATQQEKVICQIHGVEMERRVSKRTQGHYFAHKVPGGELCFGRVKA